MCDHAPQDHRHAGSACTGTGRRVDRAGYTPEEVALLAVMRRVFLCCSMPDRHLRNGLIDCARRFFGADGANICSELLALTRAMYGRRRSVFDFSNPHCPVCNEHLTYCEHQLMAMIRESRQGNITAACVHALILCDGNDPDRLVSSARQLAFVIATHLERSAPGE